MPRFKHIGTSPKLLPVDLEAQLLPGTFEHALHHLIDREIDFSELEARFHNDECGAPAFPPSMLLKVVLFAYSRGIVSSRAIERACREHVLFIALSGDTCPLRPRAVHAPSFGASSEDRAGRRGDARAPSGRRCARGRTESRGQGARSHEAPVRGRAPNPAMARPTPRRPPRREGLDHQ